jgi:primosomal protein N' (replication factor Y) (superfamily II helicase)
VTDEDAPAARAAGAPRSVAPIARVHVEVEPLHLDRPFDYLVPAEHHVSVGSRVEVLFAGRRTRGLVVEVADSSEVDPARLRPIRRVLGEHVWVRPDELGAMRWLADRTGAPLADVLRHALPRRVIAVERAAAEAGWYPPGAGRRPTSDPPPEASRLDEAWAGYGADGTDLRAAVADGTGSFLWRPLPGEDLAARVGELVQLCLAGDRDALVVVPDPSSPAADGVVAAASDLVVDLRGDHKERGLYRRWLEARTGRARVVVGLRGASLWPLERLGLAVVLDEANPALKERRSPRHHAREVVLERARRAGGVGLLVGTVPSAPAWRLLRERRVRPVVPTRQAERDARPRITLVPEDGRPRTRLAAEATGALRRATRAGTYGVVLAARRGEGRALVCGRCGERTVCPTCASSLALGAGGAVLCEGCGWRAARLPACPACGERRPVPLAAGAAWLGRELARANDVPVAVLEGYARTPPPAPAVLVTTRGSVLDTPPGPVGAVVLADLDGALRRPTLDAAEDTLRLAFQVASWAAHRRTREVLPSGGEVVVQSREPDHHAIDALVRWDPGAFWRTEVATRAALRFPPVTVAVRLAVTSRDPELGRTVRDHLPSTTDVLGPLPVDDEVTFLLKTDDRAATLAGLRPLRERWSKAGVAHRVDVDPVDA